MSHATLQATAQRLIQKNGRQVQLVQLVSANEDDFKPWRGPDPGGSETLTSIYAAFVPPNTVRQFGLTSLGLGSETVDLMARSEQIAIICPVDIDARDYEAVIDDDGTRWTVEATQTLRPGTVEMLAFLALRR